MPDRLLLVAEKLPNGRVTVKGEAVAKKVDLGLY